MTEFAVGDEAYYRGYNSSIMPVKVVRLTQTQIVTSDGNRWRRDNNKVIGANSYSAAAYATLFPMTSTARDKAETAQARRFLANLPTMTDEQARTLSKLVKEFLGSAKGEEQAG